MYKQLNGLTVPVDCEEEAYQLDIGTRVNLLSQVKGYYEVPGRFYHDINHVNLMLSTYIDEFKQSTTDALFLSIIMHDAIYIPNASPDSEEASMKLLPYVFHSITGEKIPMPLYDRVQELIRWTLPAIHIKDNKLKLKPFSDEEALLDIDLCSMSDPNWYSFIRTQERISYEFAHTGSAAELMHGSANFLQLFVNKGFVYYSQPMQERNATALRNLKAYISAVKHRKFTSYQTIVECDPDILAQEYDS